MIFDGKIPKTLFRDFLLTKIVALFTMAWIEIQLRRMTAVLTFVALFTRAWIEIVLACKSDRCGSGRLLYEGVD